MGTRLNLTPLFRSPSQARLLTQLFVFDEEAPISLTDLAARLEIPISTVQREVARLEKAGLLRSERIGNTRLVRADTQSPIFEELRSLLLKAFGPTVVLESLLGGVAGVEKAFVYGSWARRYAGEDVAAPRDIDILVVGSADPNAVYSAARLAEQDLGIEVNPVVVSRREWADEHGLLARIREGPLIELSVDEKA